MPEMFRVSMTVEGVRHRVEAMLTEHMANLDEDIKTAVGEACGAFDVGTFIRHEAKDALHDAIRKVVVEAIEEGLKNSTAFRKRVQAGVSAAMEAEPKFPDFAAAAVELVGKDHPARQGIEDALRNSWFLGRRGF